MPDYKTNDKWYPNTLKSTTASGWARWGNACTKVGTLIVATLL
jgi:hypothetical protein